MGYVMGYVLEVFDIETEELVYDCVYTGWSGNAMMDEVKHLYRTRFPRDKYRIEFR